jgi:hypothetical protein
MSRAGGVGGESHVDSKDKSVGGMVCPRTAERMVVGGGVFSEDVRGHAVTGPTPGREQIRVPSSPHPRAQSGRRSERGAKPFSNPLFNHYK